jgi:hypothetical protein
MIQGNGSRGKLAGGRELESYRGIFSLEERRRKEKNRIKKEKRRERKTRDGRKRREEKVHSNHRIREKRKNGKNSGGCSLADPLASA